MPILEVLSWLYTSCSFAVLVSHLTVVRTLKPLPLVPLARFVPVADSFMGHKVLHLIITFSLGWYFSKLQFPLTFPLDGMLELVVWKSYSLPCKN